MSKDFLNKIEIGIDRNIVPEIIENSNNFSDIDHYIMQDIYSFDDEEHKECYYISIDEEIKNRKIDFANSDDFDIDSYNNISKFTKSGEYEYFIDELELCRNAFYDTKYIRDIFINNKNYRKKVCFTTNVTYNEKRHIVDVIKDSVNIENINNIDQIDSLESKNKKLLEVKIKKGLLEIIKDQNKYKSKNPGVKLNKVFHYLLDFTTSKTRIPITYKRKPYAITKHNIHCITLLDENICTNYKGELPIGDYIFLDIED